MICPKCNHTFTSRKPKALQIIAKDRSQMSDAEIYANYHATSHIEDVRFCIKHGIVYDMPGDLRQAWEDLLIDAEGGLRRSEVNRRLRSLQTKWNCFKIDRDRRMGIPEVNGGRDEIIVAA
jgi:hypothetical protein